MKNLVTKKFFMLNNLVNDIFKVLCAEFVSYHPLLYFDAQVYLFFVDYLSFCTFVGGFD
jgi:hypothetical protein